MSASASNFPDSITGSVSTGDNAAEGPIFTKLVLNRQDVLGFEQRIRQLSEQFEESALYSREDLAEERLQRWGKVVLEMVQLFKSSDTASSNHISVLNIGTLKFAIVSISESKVSLSNGHCTYSFVVDAGMIRNLSDVFSVDLAVDTFVDYHICTLLRFALGYM